MEWVATSETRPDGEVLIYSDGRYYVAVLVEGADGSEPSFMDANSSDLVPWPQYWMPLPAPPA